MPLAFPLPELPVIWRGAGAGWWGSRVPGLPTNPRAAHKVLISGLFPSPRGMCKGCNSVFVVSPDDEEEEEDDREEEQSSGPRVYIGDVPSVTVIPKLVPQVLPEEQEGDEGMSDSDSEGPILYKDDEDEEEDESHNSKALTLQLAFSLC